MEKRLIAWTFVISKLLNARTYTRLNGLKTHLRNSTKEVYIIIIHYLWKNISYSITDFNII